MLMANPAIVIKEASYSSGRQMADDDDEFLNVIKWYQSRFIK